MGREKKIGQASGFGDGEKKKKKEVSSIMGLHSSGLTATVAAAAN